MKKFNIAKSEGESVIMDFMSKEELENSVLRTEKELQNSVLKTLVTSEPNGNGYTLFPDVANDVSKARSPLYKDITDNFFKHLTRLNRSRLSHVNGVISERDKQVIMDNFPKSREDAISRFRSGFTANIGGKTTDLIIFDRNDINSNFFEVSKEVPIEGTFRSQLDIVVFINGVPVSNLELKKRNSKESVDSAIKQIKRYSNGGVYNKGLFVFTSIFAVSNNVKSYYFARSPHVEKDIRGQYSHIFSWADQRNNEYESTTSFAKNFYNKRTFTKILMKMQYIPSEDKVFVLNPHQFYGVESLYKNAIDRKNSFVWHSTGTGKTLCSYVLTKELANSNKYSKIVFIVDRVDLANQTAIEYNNFANGNSFEILRAKLLKDELKNTKTKVLVTTTHSLSKLLQDNKRNLGIDNNNIAFIVDECHRTVGGELLASLKKWANKDTCVFLGFTGTPVFQKELKNGDIKNTLITTEGIFGEVGHTYTMADAILKGNVLPFKIQEIKVNTSNIDKNTLSPDDGLKYYEDSVRIKAVVKSLVKTFKKHTVIGETNFSAMLACSGKQSALRYYTLLQEEFKNLDKKVATVFSASANEEIDNMNTYIVFNEIWRKYDEDFGTNFHSPDLDFSQIDTDDRQIQDGFSTLRSKYVIDVSDRVKSGEIDLLVVSDMFLTGFDAPIVNTIYLDKSINSNLSLVQAISRPNRLLNKDKKFAQVVTFSDRDLKDKIIEAIQAYSNKDNLTGIAEVLDYKKLISRIIEPLSNLLEWKINGSNLERKVGDKTEIVNDLKTLANVSSYLSDVFRILNLLKVCEDWDNVKTFEKILKNLKEDKRGDRSGSDLSSLLSLYQCVISEIRQSLTETPDDENKSLFDISVDVDSISSVIIDAVYIRKLMSNVVLSPESERKKWVEQVRRSLNVVSVDDMDYITRKAFNNVVDSVESGLISNINEIGEKFNEFFDSAFHEELIKLANESKIGIDSVEGYFSNFYNSGNHTNSDMVEKLKPNFGGMSARREARLNLCSKIEELGKIQLERLHV